MNIANNGFVIAEYQETDFIAVAELFKNVYIETYKHFDEKFHNKLRFQKNLSHYVLPGSKVWTAKYEDKIIGFVAITNNFIDQLYIDKSFQGKGLGSFRVKKAKTIYPNFLELYTFNCNKNAIAFYEKHGFKIIERGVAPDEKMPDVKMRWEDS